MSDIVEQQTKAAEQEWLESWQLGPVRLKWEKMPVMVGDTAPDLELKDSKGKDTQLSAFWKEKPLLLIFWRHYGCSCGSDRAARLIKEYPDYEKTGGQVVVVGQGEPERTAAYAVRVGLTCTILCDPKHFAYEAYGLLDGTPAQVLFDSPDEFLQRDYATAVKFQAERRKLGHPPVDSAWQLPGEFVINTKGVIELAYRYNFCEDWPDHRVLVAALRKASGQL